MNSNKNIKEIVYLNHEKRNKAQKAWWLNMGIENYTFITLVIDKIMEISLYITNLII